LAFTKVLASYKKQGFNIEKKRKTKLAEWAVLTKDKEGFLSFGKDEIYVYHVEGDVKLANMNDFLKRYRKIYEDVGFESTDKGLLSYTGLLNVKEFRKVAKNFLDKDQYKGMKIKQVKSRSLQETKTKVKRKRLEKEEIKEKITVVCEIPRKVVDEIEVSVKSIKRNINRWKKNAPRVTGRGKEMKMTLSMTGFLSSAFPNILLEQRLSGNRIDAVIDKIGIEAKYRPNQNDINRLYGQVDDYLRYLEHIIVVFFDTNQAQINNFRRKITSGGYIKKITLMSI
jgi:hypothetical protein